MAMDLELALRAMDDNHRLLKQLAIIFSEDAPKISTEFEMAIIRQNSTPARMAIHSLKGLAATFFDQQTVDEFSSIEQLCVDENWAALLESPRRVFSRIGELIREMLNAGLIPAPIQSKTE